MQKLSSRLVACVATMLAAGICLADDRYFVYTYDWFTPTALEREFELHWTQFEGGNGLGQLELEYGFTDRYVVAPYLLFEKVGDQLLTGGWKVEQRYRLGEFAYNRLLPTVYLEINKFRGAEYGIEGKLIGSLLPNPNWIISGNLVVEKELASGERAEFGYSLGVARRFPNSRQAGIEAFGNWEHNEHWIGPTIGWGRTSDVRFMATLALPFAGGGPAQLRLLLAKEF